MNHNRGLRSRDSGGKRQAPVVSVRVAALTLLFAVCWLPLAAMAADNPLHRMRDDTMSYFKPLAGKVMTVEGKKITVNVGAKDSVRKGMRYQVLREEAPFRHPVTKELLGKLEAFVGRLEIREVGPDSSAGVITEGDAKEGDKIRVSEVRVNVLFCQSKDVDWHISDSYYRILKETGRFNLLDTSMDTDVPSKAIEEARRLRADVALLLVPKKADSGIVLIQKLYWVSDGLEFSELNANIDTALSKELSAGETLFQTAHEGAWLQFDLPLSARHITVCDIDGDGKKEVVLATEKDINVYVMGADIHPAHGGLKITLPVQDSLLRLDSVDLNRNGKAEIIVTSMKANDIISSIYEFNGSEFVLLYKDKVFLRSIENGLIAQAYSRAEGFAGEVFSIVWDGTYKRGDPLRLPKGINIYDFAYLEDARADGVLLAYDEWGFLNVYNSKGVRLWRSKTDTGGFLNSFTRNSPSLPPSAGVTPAVLVDRGEWSTKDRLLGRNHVIFSIERVPLVQMMKGLGFQKARIKTLWWNGLSVEERVLIDNIQGTLFDYAVDDDTIIALTSPLFGIKAGNILTGKNPLQTVVLIYKVKGK